MGSPRIAVVIPTWNRGALVERAVASVRAQTVAAHEILVVDDGSTDDTESRMRRHGDSVRYLRQQNAGAGAARNNGMRAAASEWVAFLDSDDVFAFDHLARLSQAIDGTGGRPATFFRDTQEEGEAQTFWQKCAFAAKAPFEVAADAMDWAMLPVQPILPSSMLVHRERALALGGMPALPMREDTSFLFTMALHHPMCAVPGVGALLSTAAGPNRQTVQVSPRTWSYWECTLRLYADIWARCAAAGHPRTAELHGRVANCVWRIGRLAMTSGRTWLGSRLLLRSKLAAMPGLGRWLLPRSIARAGAVIARCGVGAGGAAGGARGTGPARA